MPRNFCAITAGDSPASRVHEDELTPAFIMRSRRRRGAVSGSDVSIVDLSGRHEDAYFR